MKYRASIAILCAFATLVGCSSEPVTEKASAKPETVAMSETFEVGKYQLHPAISSGSVQMIPITMVSSPSFPKQDDVITLAQAKQQGVVDILESDTGMDVNAVSVTNRGDKPILLMGGDLLIGGHQDRIVARDVIVPPGKTVDVEVFCVEQGRSTGATAVFAYNDSVVPDRVRRASYLGQESVWDEVDSYNTSAGFSQGSLTVASGLNSKSVQKSIKDQLDVVTKSLEKKPEVVGMMFVVNGKVKSVDLFGSPKFFNTAKTAILKGYLAEGATTSPNAETKFDKEEAAAFLREVLRGRRKGREAQKEKNTFKVANGETVGYEVESSAGFIHGNYARSN